MDLRFEALSWPEAPMKGYKEKRGSLNIKTKKKKHNLDYAIQKFRNAYCRLSSSPPRSDHFYAGSFFILNMEYMRIVADPRRVSVVDFLIKFKADLWHVLCFLFIYFQRFSAYEKYLKIDSCLKIHPVVDLLWPSFSLKLGVLVQRLGSQGRRSWGIFTG